MRILLHRADGITAPWVEDFAKFLPEAEVVVWQEGTSIAPCDFAVVFAPPAAMLADLAHVKAIFSTGAGVDAIMKYNEVLPQVPVVRLADVGMGIQMAEYVTHYVLRYYRRFDEYDAQARAGTWQPLQQHQRSEFSIGLMGPGVLGMHVLKALAGFGFPLRCWSRTPKQIDGVTSFAGMEQLDDFLAGTRVLVCMIPHTPETNNLLDRARLSKLPKGAYLINVARGALVAEPDLLTLIKSGHIAGATLDVFRNEPLPQPHPFWQEPRILITPHISALTLRTPSIEQIAGKMKAFAAGQPIADIVDRTQGY
jgi:glyoxylate/hydroxypyruvate reductase A